MTSYGVPRTNVFAHPRAIIAPWAWGRRASLPASAQTIAPRANRLPTRVTSVGMSRHQPSWQPQTMLRFAQRQGMHGLGHLGELGNPFAFLMIAAAQQQQAAAAAAAAQKKAQEEAAAKKAAEEAAAKKAAEEAAAKKAAEEAAAKEAQARAVAETEARRQSESQALAQEAARNRLAAEAAAAQAVEASTFMTKYKWYLIGGGIALGAIGLVAALK